MIKRLNMFYAVIFMFFAMTTVSFASNLPSSWAQEEVNQAIKLGYVPKELQGDYQKAITREEFATLFVTAIFSDINDTNSRKPEYMKEAWHFRELNVDNFLSKVKSSQVFEDTSNKYVKVANMLGIINGNSDTTFNPNGKITREQAAIMLSNYVQVITVPALANKENLEDYNKISPWARNGVIFAYESLLMNGTRKIIDDDLGNMIQKALFSGKNNLTREQAILIVYRMGRQDRDLIDELILRGYVKGNMDILMSGVLIDGDTVKYKSSGYNNKYTDFNVHLKSMKGKYPELINDYTSEKLNSIFFAPPGPDSQMYDDEHLHKVLNDTYCLYNYGSYTVEYNKDGYLTVLNKTEEKGLFAFGAYLMFGCLSDEKGPTKVRLIEFK